MISSVESSLAFAPCAVIGQPISHSISPRLHAAFARQFNRSLRYDRIEASAAEFASRVHGFFSAGGRGMNVTLPHKMAAFALADVCHPRAVWAGAANTLWMQDNQLHADNSDGAGLLNDLQRLQIPLQDKSLVVVGAGGAAAGILPLLLQQNPAQIALINRSAERAQKLREHSRDSRVVCDSATPAEVIISTVSEGFEELSHRLLFDQHAIVYDLNYGARAEASRLWAQQQGLVMHDGFGMLIEQAAVSFAIWHGVSPDTRVLHSGEF